jgi:mycothiol system anti-sigma-R factor
MSCGNHHDTPCQEVLDAVFLYIDNEMTDGEIHEAITIHLKECGPCFMEFSLLQRLKHRVFKSCSESAPDTLLDAVRDRIAKLRFTMTEVEIRSE